MEKIVDTNILVRLFIRDIPEQTEIAKNFFRQVELSKAQAQISLLVLNELIWILANYYKLQRKDYVPQLLKILALKQVKILEVKKSLILGVLHQMQKTNIDFTDLYLLNIASKEQIFSFDKDFKKNLR